MKDLSPCRVCGFEFINSMAVCPRCEWPRQEGEGGVRGPRTPCPASPPSLAVLL